MKAKHALILFSVVLAVASAAAIGSFMPEGYWMTAYQTEEPGIAPGEGTIPVANQDLEGTPMAKVPLAQWPGHPGGIYTEVMATAYGSINITAVTVGGSSTIGATSHIAPDKLSAETSFTADTRDYVWVNFTLYDNRDDIHTIYITVISQPGVEVGATINGTATTGGKIFHLTPGVWIGESTAATANAKPGVFKPAFYIYGQPIASGDRYVTITFTAE